MLYQFLEMGFSIQGYEVSAPRARFGRDRLHLPIETDLSRVRSDNQIVFCSHVIEHVPNPRELLETLLSLCADDGFVIVMCPNGSQPVLERHPNIYHRLWGKVHPNMITDRFIETCIGTRPYLMASSMEDIVDQLRNWNRETQVRSEDISGLELFLIASGLRAGQRDSSRSTPE
jgi:2-polyprenyl-3-methyl-5-hydroxy-6-metoxy-1,4-benzoquinol methylase